MAKRQPGQIPANENLPDEIWTVEDLAAWLKVKESWIYQNIRSIPHHKIGRQLRFRRVEVLEFLQATRRGPRLT